MERYRRIKAEISLDAVKQNFESMRANIHPDTGIIAVIKADGYGHGAVPIAKLMEPESYIWGFAAATAEEALELREAGIEKPVLILGPVFHEYYDELVRRNIRIPVMDLEDARAFGEAGIRNDCPAVVHLALDTGMSRIGFADQEESVKTILQIRDLPGIRIEGMFTHFARADETDRSPADVQLARYLAFADRLEKAGVRIPLRHCSNSAGIIRMPQANLNAVRAGITMYGIYPSAEVEREPVSLAPVMKLISHVSFVKTVPAGTAVSYGGTWVAERPTCLATIPAGYADGYPRMLSGKGWVLIHGQKAPICGRVCMDQFMVDVTDIPDVRKGDRVILLGTDGEETITADTLGDLSGRFSYELVCEISSRVPRTYVYRGQECTADRLDEILRG